MTNAIKIQDNTNSETFEPSEEAHSLEPVLLDFLTMVARSPEAAIETLLLTYTSLVVHLDGSLAMNKERAREMLDMMFAYCEREHADCITDNGGHTH